MKKVPRQYRESILESVESLIDFPDFKNLDIKPLKKHKYHYRIRVGRYRIFFDDKEKIKIIAIQEVKKRDEGTY